MNGHFYTAFGLAVRSSEKLSHLRPASLHGRSAKADIRIEFSSSWETGRADPDEAPLHVFPNPADASSPFLSVWKNATNGGYRLRFDSSVEFKLERSGRRITVSRENGAPIEDVSAYLLGPVMGLTLRLRGLVCLHASAVLIEGRAVALMAPPGYGKSTLAAAFAKTGKPVITDDILVLAKEGKRFQVRPSYPHIRLPSTSVASLFGRRQALPKLSPQNPNLSKHLLDLTASGYRFADEPAGLGAVYTGTENDRTDATRVEGLNAAGRFLALCANVYLPGVIDEKMHRTHFDLLEQVAGSVPVRRIVTPSRKAMTASELRDLILEDFHRSCGVRTGIRIN